MSSGMKPELFVSAENGNIIVTFLDSMKTEPSLENMRFDCDWIFEKSLCPIRNTFLLGGQISALG